MSRSRGRRRLKRVAGTGYNRGVRPVTWYPAICVAVLLALIAAACETVPVTGRRQLQLLSPSEEMELGVATYQQILKKVKVSTDPQLNALVTRVGSRIAAATGRTDFQWEYRVIEDPQANAFALPGGKIAVYTGILPITRDEAGLAAVLGHEVAHVTARHGGERMSQDLAAQLGVSALSIASGVALGDPGATQLAAKAFGLGAQYGVLFPFNRAQESEADRIGLIYMAKAGYDPRAARDLWIRMAEASKAGQRPPEFLSTHPSEQTRIKQIEDWLPEALKHYQPAAK
jgi:predicted Zn-dependent protease